MAQFEKGNSIGGRKKGASNKANKQLKDMLVKLVNKNLDQLQADMDALTPLERVNAYIKLLQFVIPKNSKKEVSKEVTTRTLTISPVVAPIKTIS